MKIIKILLSIYFLWIFLFIIEGFRQHISIRLAYGVYPMVGSFCDFGDTDYHPFLEIVDFDGNGIIHFYKDKIVTKYGEYFIG